MRRPHRRYVVGLLLLVVAVGLVALGRLLIDRDPVTGVVSMRWPDVNYRQFRVMALVVGAVVGAGLATSGVLLQALLRNPLASPFILGISSGAGLGVMVALYIAHETGRALIGGHSGPATLGALGTLAIVYGLAQRRGWLDPVSLVLIGVVMSTICAAGIMFFQHLVDAGLIGDFTRWLMGFIDEDPPRGLLWSAVGVVSVGLVVALLLGRAMDVATVSDDEARSIGLIIAPLRVGMFILAGVLTAMSVALAGPIGFIGLIAPHLGRLVLGPRHTTLVLGSALIGIVLVVGADIARQAIDLGGGRMPIGIFTALIGGPTFIWLLRSGRGQP